VSDKDQVLHLALAQLKPNPHQARQTFEHGALEELTSSIREHGILVPIVVTPVGDGSYYIVAGERRFRAAGLAGLATVPAVVRDATELQRMELGLIENIQRQDLNPVELAFAYQKLADEFSLTQEQIAQKVGKARPSVANTLRVLQLPEPMQKAIADGKITFGHAKLLLSVPNAKERQDLFEKMLKEDMSVRAAALSGDQGTIVKSHRRSRGKNPALAELERQLQDNLGTKVRISATGTGGEITVTYYDAAELKRISQKLLGSSS
jgi:ParB family chromosome partitioning protein